MVVSQPQKSTIHELPTSASIGFKFLRPGPSAALGAFRLGIFLVVFFTNSVVRWALSFCRHIMKSICPTERTLAIRGFVLPDETYLSRGCYGSYTNESTIIDGGDPFCVTEVGNRI